ncbi:MAG: hypothetical protein RMJ56_11930 [Gemmataceae bacterium]|nr:hypothetical protein [Gemmata sp.]MDW8198300.1 hypothetical protein [Gemmataceae bacterium]
MRTIVVILLLGSCGVLNAQPTTPAELMKAGKFTAKFPSEAKAETRTAGGLTVHMTFADYDQGKAGFMVVYSDLPTDKVKAATADQILDSGITGLKDNFRAKVTEATPTEHGAKKYPARLIKAEKDEPRDWAMHGKLVLVGNRLYQVFVFGSKDFVASSTEAKQFIDSFDIVE